jgi:hypothetical protein
LDKIIRVAAFSVSPRFLFRKQKALAFSVSPPPRFLFKGAAITSGCKSHIATFLAPMLVNARKIMPLKNTGYSTGNINPFMFAGWHNI